MRSGCSVEDPEDMLRLGMPSTVTLLPDAAPKPLPKSVDAKAKP